MFKKIIIIIYLIINIFLTLSIFADAPSYSADYKEKVAPDAYNLKVDSSKSLQENITTIFYPASGGSQIRNVIRVIGVGILICSLAYNGLMFVLNANEDLKKYQMNFLYIFYGTILFFGSTWILDKLSIGSANLSDNSLITNLQNNIFFQGLSFLKAFAFFFAIMCLVYYGFKMMRAFEKEDKIKEARAGILNVVVALLLIKLIDYVYFIAQQQDFKNKAGELIVSINKAMLYLLGSFFVLSLFYAGYLLVVSGGNDDSWKKAKTVVTTVFLTSLIVVLFLLVIHQVVNEF